MKFCSSHPALRLPIVMAVANRSHVRSHQHLERPLAMLCPSGTSGWIQTFAENGQEVLDLTLHAFKVAEDRPGRSCPWR